MPGFKPEDLSVNMADFDKELTDQAANYFFVAQQAVEATTAFEQAKQKMELLEAQLDACIREQLAAKGQKATEGQVAKLLIATPSYQNAQSAILKLRKVADMAKKLESAWYMRASMLKALNQKLTNELSMAAMAA